MTSYGIRPYWRDGYPDSLEVIALADGLGLLFDQPHRLFSEPLLALRHALTPLKPTAFPCELPPFRARWGGGCRLSAETRRGCRHIFGS